MDEDCAEQMRLLKTENAVLQKQLGERWEEISAYASEGEKLQAEIERLKDRYNRDVNGLNNEGDPIGGDPAGGYINDLRSTRSEIDQLKAEAEDLKADRDAWEETAKSFEDFYRKTEDELDQLKALLLLANAALEGRIDDALSKHAEVNNQPS